MRQEEININLCGPIHLTSLFVPHLIKQKQSAIINVTSGLAFSPYSPDPIYSATKGGLHQFNMALRPLLAQTSVRLVELAPPMVQTSMPGTSSGEPLDVFCQHVYDRFKLGELEIGYKSRSVNVDYGATLQNSFQPRLG